MKTRAIIDSFDGDNRWLSNFALSPHTVHAFRQDLQGSTVEHTFQAMKATNANDRIKVLNAGKPGEAKRVGREIEKREDWERIKVKVMRNCVLAKFTQNPRLAEKLLATGDAQLIEGNWWGDRFWGVCRGEGENHLGRILMWARATLRRRQPKEVVVGAVADEGEGEVDSIGDPSTSEVTTPLPDDSVSAPQYSGPWALLDRYLDEVAIYSSSWQWIKNGLYREVCMLPGIEDEIISRMERGDIHWPFFTILARQLNYDPTNPTREDGFIKFNVQERADKWVQWYRNRTDPNYWSEKESDQSPDQASG